MSRPQFPDVPGMTRQNAVNQVIASIAAEELALSHVINTEGEKIQYAVGTLPGLEEASTVEEVLAINNSANQTLGAILENQILLTGKLSDAVRAPVFPGPTGPTATSIHTQQEKAFDNKALKNTDIENVSYNHTLFFKIASTGKFLYNGNTIKECIYI